MYYRNARAESDGRDPRKELEEFVLANKPFINRDSIRETAPNLSASDQDDWLREFVLTNNPYDVLENCFYDLQKLAEDQLKINKNLNLEYRELVGKVLYKLGFREEVKPSGLSQIRAEIEQHLAAKGLRQMDQAMQGLLQKLFLFYTYILRWYAAEEAGATEHEDTEKAWATEEAEVSKKVDAIAELEKLRQRHQTMPQAIGQYFQLLRDLMSLVQEDRGLSNYCRSCFQREVPLNQNQIAELGMFALYRNLVSHPKPPPNIWGGEEKKAKANLKNMDDTTRREWEGSWNNVVMVYESQQHFPPEKEMIQRMVGFFREFLNSLSENQIYPKVIVMRSYTVDDYGTRQITAIDDAEKTVFLVDCDFKPFTEFYCHSRANSFGIEPILVRKQELEKWATQTDDDTED